MKTLTTITLLFLSVTLIGCGAPRPADFPATAPCRITVLQNGKPMEGVIVSLYREEGNGALVIDGTTNTTGIADIQTKWGNYTVKGAPIGNCKITVDKYFEMPPETVTPEESALWTEAQGAAYEKQRMELADKLRIIPKQIADTQTTPLTVNIESGKTAELTVYVEEFP